MHKTIYILVLSAVIWMVGSCSNLDELPIENDTLLHVTYVSTLNEITRSTSTLAEGSIGVFLGAKTNVVEKYSCSNSVWSTNSASAILSSTTPISVCAYYPYSASYNNATAIPLTSQIYSSQNDFCYSFGKSASSLATKVDFAMNHAYAKIAFYITRNANYQSPCKITNISIVHSALIKTATLNITNGNSATVLKDTVKFNPAINTIALGDTAIAQVLMVPVAAISNNVTFVFTVDGVQMSTSLNAATNELSSLVAGNSYKVEASIYRSKVLNTDGVNVVDWNNKDLGDKEISPSVGLTVKAVSIADWNVVPLGNKAISNALPKESNCYMVNRNSYIKIPVSRVKTVGITTLTKTWSAGLLWTDQLYGSEGSIKSIIPNISDGYILVETGNVAGNGIIYIKNASGTIVWSWHIWVTDYKPDSYIAETTRTYNGYTWMVCDIGSTDIDSSWKFSNGLYFQWGRKDPFASTVIYDENRISIPKQDATVALADNLVMSVNNPGCFYTNATAPYDWYTTSATAQKNDLWSATKKTNYDPCPLGWRVPPMAAWGTSFPTPTKEPTGRLFSSIGWYPFMGFLIGNDKPNGTGTSGYNWGATASGEQVSAFAYNLNDVYLYNKFKRAYGMHVRCVKE